MWQVASPSITHMSLVEAQLRLTAPQYSAAARELILSKNLSAQRVTPDDITGRVAGSNLHMFGIDL